MAIAAPIKNTNGEELVGWAEALATSLIVSSSSCFSWALIASTLSESLIQASPCFLMSLTLDVLMPLILDRLSKDENGLKEINSSALASPMWIILTKSIRGAVLMSIFSEAEIKLAGRAAAKAKEKKKIRLDKLLIMVYNRVLENSS